jgi:protein-L-isoaspartate(D-aspartate) O-methyltransferase
MTGVKTGGDVRGPPSIRGAILARETRRRYNECVASREDLVRTLRVAGIRNQRVLDVFRTIPRDRFVLPEWRRRAYEDVPLPIPHGQVTTQPSLIARMLEGLELSGGERVLEVGTGLGFQTALLAALAREVWSVERWPDIAATARANLAAQGLGNAKVFEGDGSRGLAKQGPFEAIIVAAAFSAVPPPLSEQLTADGRLVQPIGPGGREDVTLFVRDAGRLRPQAVLTGAHFVRLIGAHGFGEG